MAELKIYDSISDTEPSKVYTCHRTTMAINNQLEELTEEVNQITKQIDELAATVTDETTADDAKKVRAEIKALEARASELTLESIRLFFPAFTDAEFMKLDPYDYQTFVFEIGKLRSKIYTRTVKN